MRLRANQQTDLPCGSPGSESNLGKKSERLAELDALRGLAALAVVFFHLLPAEVYWGWMGVDVFFVLSGFLITRIILQGHRRVDFLKNFYVRRILRIWPAYYLALAGALVLALMSRTHQPMGGLPYALFFVQNTPAYWGHPTPPFTLRMGHTWTVAMEEQFYIVWPLIVPRLSRTFPWVALLLLLIAFVMRLSLPTRPDLLLTRCDGLVFGAGIAWYWSRRGALEKHQRARLIWFALFGLVLVYGFWGTLVYGKPFLDGIPLWPAPTFLVVSLFAALLVTGVLTLAGSPILAPLRVPALVYVGRISYALYLFHKLVFWIADGLLERFGWGRSVIFNIAVVVCSLGVAMASWQLIEKPILSRASRFPV